MAAVAPEAAAGEPVLFLCLPIPNSGTRTRIYVNGHPTNGFATKDVGIYWYRDPGCAGDCTFFAKKLC